MKTLKPIPLINVSLSSASRESAQRCMLSSWLGYGPECLGLERTFTDTHKGWALATSSCTSALHIAASICWDKMGDEVILPPITFVSAAMAFAYSGFVPRFADVDEASLMPTLESVADRITPRTRVVVAVHLYGQRASMLALRKLCDSHGIFLVEDCAHRIDLFDAEVRIGDFACFSFNAMKEVPCGEGGILWGRDATHEESARAISNGGLHIDTLQRIALRNHRDYEFSNRLGLKLRLNDILAAIVTPALATLPEQRKQRRKIFEIYDNAFCRVDSCIMPLIRQNDDSFLMYVVRLTAEHRARIREIMAEAGVASSTHYPSLTRHPLLNPVSDACPIAEKLAECILTLPSYPELEVKDQYRVIDALTYAVL